MPRIPPHVFWPGLVVALLCTSVAAVTVTIVAAVGDPSFAVEEDYYERALRWDEHVAQRARSAALGWSAGVEVGAGEAGPSLTVTLLDAAGAPVEGAEISATYFHFANRAGERTVTLSAGGAPGRYTAGAAFDRPGLWRVSVVASAGGETFTIERTLDLGRG